VSLSLRIRVTKRIPAAAGLAGGSSDAAATLAALSEIFSAARMPRLPDAELIEMAKSIGADVPFCLADMDAALAGGIGERLEPLQPLPASLSIVLANPNLPIKTAWAFSRYAAPPAGEPGQSRRASCADILAQAMKSQPEDFFACAGAGIFNDLEAVAVPAHPVIGELKELLLRHGAGAALMSGSGATVFGLFGSPSQAATAQKDISTMGFWATVC
jgi:4-diphosphocytidyl-2-C-methyl-D-erythritol kinase